MNTKKYSNKQEKDIAKKFNGNKQFNSGATPFHKGDVISNDFLFECKTSITNKKSYSIKQEDLEKLKKEKFSMGRLYEALVFNFGPETENYYVITEQTILDFIELLKEE